MSKSFPKIPCSHAGCRAYAMHDTDPPICSVHAGRNLHPGHGKRLGAPEGNHNALTHGFYSHILRDANIGEPLPAPDAVGIEDEIAISRVALRRILAMLLSGVTVGPNPRPLTAADIARLGALAFQGARTIARLLEAKASLGAGGESEFAAALNAALDHLSEEWGVQL